MSSSSFGSSDLYGSPDDEEGQFASAEEFTAEQLTAQSAADEDALQRLEEEKRAWGANQVADDYDDEAELSFTADDGIGEEVDSFDQGGELEPEQEEDESKTKWPISDHDYVSVSDDYPQFTEESSRPLSSLISRYDSLKSHSLLPSSFVSSFSLNQREGGNVEILMDIKDKQRFAQFSIESSQPSTASSSVHDFPPLPSLTSTPLNSKDSAIMQLIEKYVSSNASLVRPLIKEEILADLKAMEERKEKKREQEKDKESQEKKKFLKNKNHGKTEKNPTKQQMNKSNSNNKPPKPPGRSRAPKPVEIPDYSVNYSRRSSRSRTPPKSPHSSNGLTANAKAARGIWTPPPAKTSKGMKRSISPVNDRDEESESVINQDQQASHTLFDQPIEAFAHIPLSNRRPRRSASTAAIDRLAKPINKSAVAQNKQKDEVEQFLAESKVRRLEEKIRQQQLRLEGQKSGLQALENQLVESKKREQNAQQEIRSLQVANNSLRSQVTHLSANSLDYSNANYSNIVSQQLLNQQQAAEKEIKSLRQQIAELKVKEKRSIENNQLLLKKLKEKDEAMEATGKEFTNSLAQEMDRETKLKERIRELKANLLEKTRDLLSLEKKHQGVKSDLDEWKGKWRVEHEEKVRIERKNERMMDLIGLLQLEIHQKQEKTMAFIGSLGKQMEQIRVGREELFDKVHSGEMLEKEKLMRQYADHNGEPDIQQKNQQEIEDKKQLEMEEHKHASSESATGKRKRTNKEKSSNSPSHPIKNEAKRPSSQSTDRKVALELSIAEEQRVIEALQERMRQLKAAASGQTKIATKSK
jgi:hypothetical protein